MIGILLLTATTPAKIVGAPSWQAPRSGLSQPIVLAPPLFEEIWAPLRPNGFALVRENDSGTTARIYTMRGSLVEEKAFPPGVFVSGATRGLLQLGYAPPGWTEKEEEISYSTNALPDDIHVRRWLGDWTVEPIDASHYAVWLDKIPSKDFVTRPNLVIAANPEGDAASLFPAYLAIVGSGHRQGLIVAKYFHLPLPDNPAPHLNTMAYNKATRELLFLAGQGVYKVTLPNPSSPGRHPERNRGQRRSRAVHR